MMRKILDWWKIDNRYVLLIKVLLMACLPIVCCLIYCGVNKISLSGVYLPASEWNDELFYFKQVEGIVKFGYPRGYFGFNESHALRLSFAAWSPVLVFPWIIWGLLFGWTFMSPVICNILLLTVAVVLFVILTKPSFRQLGILSFLFVFYTQFVRYMLSGMPEIICFSMLIIFYSLAYNYLTNEKIYKLVILFVMGAIMTLMRPYLLLFLLLPIFLWIRKDLKKGIVGSVLILGVVLIGYAAIKHFLGAEYFAPLFFTDWITTFFREGLMSGIHNFFGTLYYMGKNFAQFTWQGINTGLAAGAFFAGYLVMMFIYIYASIADFIKLRSIKKLEATDEVASKELSRRLILEVHLAFSFVAMLFALLLMYKLTEGSKHLLSFMAVGIFVLTFMETKTFKRVVVLAAVFAYLYSYKAVDPYDYQVPAANEGLVSQIDYWEGVLHDNIKLSSENIPSFDNVCIWVFCDKKGENVSNIKWQILYALPEGMGISCCMPDYVNDNFSDLNSRYIATSTGGEIDALCSEQGYKEVGRDEDLVIYERY